MARIFLSSVAGALSRYRDVATDVCHRLDLIPVRMEEFRPERPPPVDTCLRLVDTADVFVLLVAHRYGSRAPAGRSFTELEYERALERGIPLHVFVVDPEFPWPPPDVSEGADATALREFVARLRRDHTTSSFGDLARFREGLLLTLDRYRPRETAPPAAPHPAVRPPDLFAETPYVATNDFLGRARDLAVIDDWARSDDTVLVVESIGGVGKSALTWRWLNARASGAVDDLAGRFWWSFYEDDSSITQFVQRLATYLTGRDCTEDARGALTEELLAELRARPYVLALDGFERLLTAYRRLDAAALLDEDVEESLRALNDPKDTALLRALADVAPSKVLINTRLMPDALLMPDHRPLRGVRRYPLHGLERADCLDLAAELGLRGDPSRIAAFFARLDNHPLLMGVVAGIVADYRPAPGDFDQWVTDPAGGRGAWMDAANVADRRKGVLASAFRGLDPAHRLLLGWIADLPSNIDYATLEQVNPFVPPAPAPPKPAWDDEDLWGRAIENPDFDVRAEDARRQADHVRAVEAWRRSDDFARGVARLDRALADLEGRGLLTWDRVTNTYDLHPVVRSLAREQFQGDDRVAANERMRDHFAALPEEDAFQATSVEDVRQTLALFRALVGCRRADEAWALFTQGLGHALRFRIAAPATTVELLEPLVGQLSTAPFHATLAEAYYTLDRVDDATRASDRALDTAMRADESSAVRSALHNLSALALVGGKVAEANRYLELMAVPELGTYGQGLARIAYMRALDGDPGVDQLLNEAAACTTPPLALAGDIAILRARNALRYGSLTRERLADLEREFTADCAVEGAIVAARVELADGHLAAALDAAQRAVATATARGTSVAFATAWWAYLLARAGDTAHAERLILDVVRGLDAVPPQRRPYVRLAEAALAIGWVSDAEDFALRAYRTAWADGPPNCVRIDLIDAEELLRRLGVALPDLPTLDPATITLPRETEIRAFIASRRAD